MIYMMATSVGVVGLVSFIVGVLLCYETKPKYVANVIASNILLLLTCAVLFNYLRSMLNYEFALLEYLIIITGFSSTPCTSLHNFSLSFPTS